MAENPNLAWHWPRRLADLLPEPCGHHCVFDADRSHRWESGDVSRCRWHARLRVVTSTNYSGDSNGGMTLTRFKRLRPWRLGYWRARQMLAVPEATR